jgi:Leucine rich repeat
MPSKIQKTVWSTIFLSAVTAWLTAGQALAGKMPAQELKTVQMAFPKDISMGHLYFMDWTANDHQYMVVEPQFSEARGLVAVPGGKLVGLRLSYGAVEKLGALPRTSGTLIYLYARGLDNFDDNAFLKACKNNSWKSLIIDETDVTDKGITDAIPSLNGLVVLSCSRTAITGKSLAAIGKVKTLERVMLKCNNLGDSSIANLASLPRLNYLDISRCAISDRSLFPITTIKSLSYLDLSFNDGITDKGVAMLHSLPNLKRLNLSHTKISPACVDSLNRLTQLTHLIISFDNFNKRDIQALRKGLSHCAINDPGTKISPELFHPLH